MVKPQTTAGRGPLSPGTSLLVKLGSLIVHHEEAVSPNAHPIDVQTYEELRADPEVEIWFEEMNGMGLLPVKR